MVKNIENAEVDMFKGYGLDISDNQGDLRDITGIVAELKEVRGNFNTEAMSDYSLYLEGKLAMLSEVIAYLERVGG